MTMNGSVNSNIILSISRIIYLSRQWKLANYNILHVVEEDLYDFLELLFGFVFLLLALVLWLFKTCVLIETCFIKTALINI